MISPYVYTIAPCGGEPLNYSQFIIAPYIILPNKPLNSACMLTKVLVCIVVETGPSYSVPIIVGCVVGGFMSSDCRCMAPSTFCVD